MQSWQKHNTLLNQNNFCNALGWVTIDIVPLSNWFSCIFHTPLFKFINLFQTQNNL